MREIKLDKVTLNIGAGTDEAKLLKAMKLLEVITGEKPVKTLAKKRIAAWKIRKGLPIGCKVTLRRKKATNLLPRLLEAIENKINATQITTGGFSFGIREYIQIPDVPYQRDIPLLGLDVSVTFGRAGFRVAKKKVRRGKLPEKQRITKEEVVDYLNKNLGINVEG